MNPIQSIPAQVTRNRLLETQRFPTELVQIRFLQLLGNTNRLPKSGAPLEGRRSHIPSASVGAAVQVDLRAIL